MATAIVTGASRGIGRAVAVRLARTGARVALVARNPEGLDQTLAQVRSAGGSGIALPGDLADRGVAEQVVEEVARSIGPPDVLVNNAAVAVLGTVADVSPCDIRQMLDVDLVATILLTRAALPHLRSSGHGHAIMITSDVARRPRPLLATYSAAKAGVNAFAEALREEVRGDGVRVTLIEVAGITSRFGEAWRRDRHEEAERLWLERGFKGPGELLSTEVVADAVEYALSRDAPVGIDLMQVRPALDRRDPDVVRTAAAFATLATTVPSPTEAGFDHTKGGRTWPT